MKPKVKIILKAPLIGWRNFRARSLAKKIKKYEDEDRYPEQWKNDFIIKRSKQFLKLLNVRLTVNGYENIPKNPAVIAPNHSSSFDVALMMAALENPEKGEDYRNFKAIFLAKESLKKNKRIRGYANILNTHYINRKKPRQALEVLDQLGQNAKEYKKHIIIFPEGTRSADGKIQDFKGGAFRIAKKMFLPIVPVTINNALSITNLQRKGKLHVTVTFHKMIKPMSFMTAQTKDIAQRVQKVVASTWVQPEGQRSELEEKVA